MEYRLFIGKNESVIYFTFVALLFDLLLKCIIM